MDNFRLVREMTMSTITNQTPEAKLGTYFADLFKLDAEQFQLLAQKPRFDRDSEYLNRPYELSDLMRQATAAGVWPR
jgi:hypothetical protein